MQDDSCLVYCVWRAYLGNVTQRITSLNYICGLIILYIKEYLSKIYVQLQTQNVTLHGNRVFAEIIKR